jgi:hypothetical protein
MAGLYMGQGRYERLQSAMAHCLGRVFEPQGFNLGRAKADVAGLRVGNVVQ